MIEEVEEKDELGESSGPKGELSAALQSKESKKADDEEEKENKKQDDGDEDFNFEVPDKLKPSVRDNTIVKKRKEEVVDVLADIAKATNLID